MGVYLINPLTDRRWPTFLQNHDDASLFHSREWLDALSRTYGHEPVVYTTSPPHCDLINGVPFSRIRSRLTGRRLVSLPFSDHCQPLVGSSDELNELLLAAKEDARKDRYKALEIRPLRSDAESLHVANGLTEKESVIVHKLDLSVGADEVYRHLHRNAVQRIIVRSERAGLTYEEGTSDRLLNQFYCLLLLTRRRHQLPPQPLTWFQNLIGCLGHRVKIRVVSKDGVPAASIITVLYKRSMMYKYGCSDSSLNALGGTVYLIWHAIKEAIAEGATEIDLGRSDCTHTGLITFKDRWGAKQSRVTYYSDPPMNGGGLGNHMLMRLVNRVSTAAPDSVLIALGRLLYPHAG